MRTSIDTASRPGHGMRRVALIYNPASGQISNHSAARIKSALAVLHAAGIDAEAMQTTAPGTAAALVRESIRLGCDTILACGGDGTVHEVLQTLAGGPTALGVVPLGTANALAADLGLPLSPAKAMQKLLTATRVRIPVGRIHYLDNEGVERSRFFTVAAGIGADALLMSRLDAKLKRRFGYALYAVEGLRILATHSFPLFRATFVERDGCEPRVEETSQLLAVRIRNFGGMLHHLVPGATLRNGTLRLVAFKTRNRFDYMRFLAAVLLKRHTFSKNIELLDALSVECHDCEGLPGCVFAEADGELLGNLPVRLEIVPDALTLLVPNRARRG
ncbi:diacylglycerol/lipid kinase family protein [Acidicapsa acidisoli]|uniref:diacylglycerol/lipid kinase family protein n=1 Tax=Acidicapsa acidisoli TaxID=1615681 RepID=UPI0021DFA00A|nr:YegS/Rv2252/BmrU family lipid kinase [Acidicapsa acidisoli]